MNFFTKRAISFSKEKVEVELKANQILDSSIIPDYDKSNSEHTTLSIGLLTNNLNKKITVRRIKLKANNVHDFLEKTAKIPNGFKFLVADDTYLFVYKEI